MAEDIINRVSNSPLITLDLEALYPQGNRVVFDIKDWLYEGLILKEHDFRAAIKDHNWAQYQDTHVALTCSTEAIIPSWAFMLITSSLAPYATTIVEGDLTLLETVIFQKVITELSTEAFEGKPVIIKGCANKPIPGSAYSFLIQKLQPVVKSLLFGEACSTVPLYKSRK